LNYYRWTHISDRRITKTLPTRRMRCPVFGGPRTLSLASGVLRSRATPDYSRIAWWLTSAEDDEYMSFDQRSVCDDEAVRFEKSRKQRGWRARDAVTAARIYRLCFGWRARDRTNARNAANRLARARRTDGRWRAVGRTGGAVELWSGKLENRQWDAGPERVFETAVQRPVTGG